MTTTSPSSSIEVIKLIPRESTDPWPETCLARVIVEIALAGCDLSHIVIANIAISTAVIAEKTETIVSMPQWVTPKNQLQTVVEFDSDFQKKLETAILNCYNKYHKKLKKDINQIYIFQKGSSKVQLEPRGTHNF